MDFPDLAFLVLIMTAKAAKMENDIEIVIEDENEKSGHSCGIAILTRAWSSLNSSYTDRKT